MKYSSMMVTIGQYLTLIDLGMLTLNAATYFVVGVLVFRFGTEVARKRGVLGHY